MTVMYARWRSTNLKNPNFSSKKTLKKSFHSPSQTFDFGGIRVPAFEFTVPTSYCCKNETFLVNFKHCDLSPKLQPKTCQNCI